MALLDVNVAFVRSLRGGLKIGRMDAFNSLVAALFLIIVGLCATLIKTNTGTLVGGVFCLLLFVLCIADAVVLLKMITFNKETKRNVTNK